MWSGSGAGSPLPTGTGPKAASLQSLWWLPHPEVIAVHPVLPLCRKLQAGTRCKLQLCPEGWPLSHNAGLCQLAAADLERNLFHG